MKDIDRQRMLLRSTDTSPFGRKIRIALLILGFDRQVDVMPASPLDPSDPLRQCNPLGKMPCLVLGDGTSLYDSPVILEYLDLQMPGRLIPIAPAPRLLALREQALADGITDAALLMGSELRFHPAGQVSQPWLEHQRDKVLRGLAAFDAAPPALESITVGAISLACGLGYLDWRKPVEWRKEYSGVADWLDRFRAATPAFDATRHVTAT